MGHELRRPEADLLRDGIYELRASVQGVHHRVLYFFHGAAVAVVSHGIAERPSRRRRSNAPSSARNGTRQIRRNIHIRRHDMAKKSQPATDAVEILHRRAYQGRPERLKALEETRANE